MAQGSAKTTSNWSGFSGISGFSGFSSYSGLSGFSGSNGIKQGTAVLNFGLASGNNDSMASVDVSDATIQANSVPFAWLSLSPTSDHSLDEVIVDPPDIMAGNVVAGVGFTIYGLLQTGEAYGTYNVNYQWM